jgi:hypothetical protein
MTAVRHHLLLATVASLLFGLGTASTAIAASPTPAPGVEVTQPLGRVVSHVTDARVPTPNSLAISSKYRGLAYVMNQEGAPIVFVIQLSTGKVVGTTILSRTTTDKPLAMAVDDGRLWIADLGDTRGNRFGGTIYSIAEPGRGARQTTPRSYDVTFGGLSSDIHGLLIEPKSDQKYLMSRNSLGEGTFWKLPRTLQSTFANRAVPESKTVTPEATDATFTPNGRKVLVLADEQIRLFDAKTWEEEVVVLPNPDTVPNGRGIAVSPDATAFYVISEGTAPEPSASPSPEPGPATNDAVIAKFPLTRQLGGVAADEGGSTAPTIGRGTTKVVTVNPIAAGAIGVALVVGFGWLVMRRIRRDRIAKEHHAKFGR